MSNTKQQIEEILDAYANHNYSQSLDFHLTPDMQFMDREQTVEAIDRLVTEACLQEFKPDMQFMDREQTVEAIDRLVTEACLQEFKTMWNKTQPDIVTEGWKPETEEGEYIKDRIAELKSQLNGKEENYE